MHHRRGEPRANARGGHCGPAHYTAVAWSRGLESGHTHTDTRRTAAPLHATGKPLTQPQLRTSARHCDAHRTSRAHTTPPSSGAEPVLDSYSVRPVPPLRVRFCVAVLSLAPYTLRMRSPHTQTRTQTHRCIEEQGNLREEEGEGNGGRDTLHTHAHANAHTHTHMYTPTHTRTRTRPACSGITVRAPPSARGRESRSGAGRASGAEGERRATMEVARGAALPAYTYRVAMREEKAGREWGHTNRAIGEIGEKAVQRAPRQIGQPILVRAHHLTHARQHRTFTAAASFRACMG